MNEGAEEAALAARAAGLRYVTDGEPGIRRERDGERWRYRSPLGKEITDERAVARIAALAIPPAWSDVWICPQPFGHLQATGRDARGRKQYRYHARWRSTRDETKYHRMVQFGEALPALRARVSADLAAACLSREKVLAIVVDLLDTAHARIGNLQYAQENDSYGLTTLHHEHVTVAGDTIHLRFRGKAGKEQVIDVRDRRLARAVRRCQDLPGHTLFQYLDDGVLHVIASHDVNAYLQATTGQAFTAKDFRTWSGTTVAAAALYAADPAESLTQRRHNVVEAIATAAAALGNTPAICRKSYVHPGLLATYLEGDLVGAMTVTAADDLPGLHPDERAVLALLRRLAAESPAAQRGAA